MKIHTEKLETVSRFSYLNARSGGGTECVSLPIAVLPTEGLPPELSGIVLTADLQGIATLPSTGVSCLLGVALVEHLEQLADEGTIPHPCDMGAILAGDLYSDPRANRRGATGDVVPVWEAFARRFLWLTGVAGNHDVLEGRTFRRLAAWREVGYLDGDVFDAPGLRVGGVSGIVGRNGKHMRKPMPSYLGAIHRVLDLEPEILVLHDGPAGPHRGQRGQPEVTELLERRSPPLTVRGHAHWNDPFWEHGAGTVINVDARAIVLVPA